MIYLNEGITELPEILLIPDTWILEPDLFQPRLQLAVRTDDPITLGQSKRPAVRFSLLAS